MAVRSVDGDNIELVANAIRTKGGTTQTLAFPNTMAAAIIGLKGASKCVSTLVKNLSYNGETQIDIPLGDITKPQVISIVKEADTGYGDSTYMIFMLTILMNPDDSTVTSYSYVGYHTSYCYYSYADPNSTYFPSVTIDGSTLTVNVSDMSNYEFAYDYRCTVYGI